MVAKLPLPEYNSITVLRAIISERERYEDFYNSLTNDWVLHVENYLEHHGDPRFITPIDLSLYLSEESVQEEETKTTDANRHISAQERLREKRKQTLINLYSPDEGKIPYDILGALRRGHNLLFCPCCGEPGKPTTLDHYLPKTVYPELAIIIANLTPMCNECQQNKSSDYFDENRKKIYIHPYFDPIEQVNLSIDIEEPYATPTFELTILDDGDNNELYELLKRHINGVKFLERFDEFCRNEYMALLRTMSLERQDAEPDRASRIIRRFKRQHESQSPNRWEAIFYRGILNNAGLLDYLDNGDLPDFT
ncbi:HNH endonuclease [Pectobacterium carotovorum]|uniref:HNH endonuclease n=1 Tax=Pectobacterium carotovorum TaxID=554 RepID=UPI0015DE01EA|nr:HNH endonuclease [Pectobacterium carotovorum]MBA0191644.1 HNH endonuclease [Pectobacterium carotovorum]MBA0199069.1 HNH endonuclease [Pectobacterium carotovorum]